MRHKTLKTTIAFKETQGAMFAPSTTNSEGPFSSTGYLAPILPKLEL